MKQSLALLLAAFALHAHAAKDDAHVKATIEQHRAIAEAHAQAAQCLESGKDEKTCHAELAKTCKGLAIGKLCGMRHKH
ncbi:MAG TPA: hypothetical protein VM406_07045 [Noviherbaspirillum sp.]|nr:hypothetical protein [Noviherbaspirillum sp.]